MWRHFCHSILVKSKCRTIQDSNGGDQTRHDHQEMRPTVREEGNIWKGATTLHYAKCKFRCVLLIILVLCSKSSGSGSSIDFEPSHNCPSPVVTHTFASAVNKAHNFFLFTDSLIHLLLLPYHTAASLCLQKGKDRGVKHAFKNHL